MIIQSTIKKEKVNYIYAFTYKYLKYKFYILNFENFIFIKKKKFIYILFKNIIIITII